MGDLIGNDPGAELAGMLISDWVSELADDDLFGVSVRFPRERVAVLDAMAKRAGVSRNRIVNMLVSAGVRDVMGRLPAEVEGELHDEIAGEL